MKLSRTALAVAAIGALSACTWEQPKHNKSLDRGFDTKDLSQLVAGIWIDPNGCQHWIIDDGVEGYLSARLDRNGKPVCSDAYPTAVAIGPFKKGSPFPDSI